MFILWKYRCHFNLECIASVKAIKYIYKYIYKGHDCTTMEFGTCQDEVKLYLDARYVSQCEAVWRLMAFERHAISPNVVRLQIHLPGQQSVTWNEDGVNPLEEILERAAGCDTTLTAYFKANQKYAEAKEILYQTTPQFFVFIAKKGEWKLRQWGFAVGCMYYVSPKAGECFYL